MRALSPAPGAWFEHAGQRIKVLDAKIADAVPGTTPGTLLDGRLTVACGAAALMLTKVQRSGKAAVDALAFLRGYPMEAGTQLA